MIDASASHLAFHAARIALSGDGLLPDIPVALDDTPTVGDSPAIAALGAAPKPVRISGTLVAAVLRLHLSSPTADRETTTRYEIWRRAIAGDHAPLSGPQTSDRLLLVVAFDRLLRATKDTWRQFITEYWIDGPFCWSADYPGSLWAREFHIPDPLLQGIETIVLFGYGAVNQFRSPFNPRSWEAA